MDKVRDPEELQLVRLAIALGKTTRGCCEWDEKGAARIDAKPPYPGCTAQDIRDRLMRFVSDQNGQVVQVVEKRREYQSRGKYWYKAIIPVAELPNGLFVEMVLVDDDSKHGSEYPVVSIVNAHE